MKQIKNITVALALIALCFSACQDFDRPEMTIVPDTPKLFFPYDNENVADKSGYEFTTEPTSGITFRTDGVNGGAVTIGNNNYILIDSPTGLSANNRNPIDFIKNPGNLTISMWIYLEKDKRWGPRELFCVSDTLGEWGNLDIFTEGISRGGVDAFVLKWHLKAGSWGETDLPMDNTFDKWTHLVFRYDATRSRMTIFHDGVSIFQKSFPGLNALKYDNVGKLVIGTFQHKTVPPLTHAPILSFGESFLGSIDQFRLYNVALTNEEVMKLYESKQ